MTDRKIVPIRKVRAWARKRGIPVGTRGHLPQELIDQFNRAHRTVAAENSNPMHPSVYLPIVNDVDAEARAEFESRAL